MSIFTADSLKNNIDNPARPYLWELVMPSPRGGGDVDTLRLRCMSAAIPRRGVTTIHVPFKGTGGVDYPGVLEYDHTMSLEFIEGEDRAIWDTFYNWCQLCVDDYKGTGMDDLTLKTDVYLTLLRHSDNTIYNKIKLIGCFVKEMSSVNLTQGSSNDMIKLSIILNFDRWESAN